MRANRRDKNHRQVINAFISLGWAILDIADLKNCCDIIIAKNGQTVAVEIKDGEKPPSAIKLTQGEKLFRDMWQEQGHWRLCKSIDDVNSIDREFSLRGAL